MRAINRKFFFDYVRRQVFKGRMSQKQVDGLNAILDAWEATYAKKDDRWLAYALGTTHHETDAKMQPIHEYGGVNYFFRMYDIKGNRMENGVFTGKKFADYFSGDVAKWEQARAIINPGDKPKLVAGYALDYYPAINYTTR